MMMAVVRADVVVSQEQIGDAHPLLIASISRRLFTPPLHSTGHHLVRGILRTRVEASQVDTLSSFTVLIDDQ